MINLVTIINGKTVFHRTKEFFVAFISPYVAFVARLDPIAIDGIAEWCAIRKCRSRYIEILIRMDNMMIFHL